MNTHSNRRRDRRRESASAAFGGLGFDMAGVVKASAGMTLRQVTPFAAEESQPAECCDRFVGPYGFALLTALGREIRGR